ncbi:MAG: hypothetical protein L7H18_00140 [Candidatus Nealsonbacteria bacterium DGGOD1a]|jgi:hypothetical protein|nr:MAG: hypothetical protein L7H18_00140 [Candidatus Nealsonbacteria bacterium DGGOD1a]
MSIRVEPFVVGDFIHAYNRGNKKGVIYFDKSDKWRFLRSIRFFNDQRDITELAKCLTDLIEFQRDFLRRLDLSQGTNEHNTFEWQEEWGEPMPLTQIISYHLSPNHFHLLMKEIFPGGVSKFMKKLGNGYTAYRNIKSGEVGRIFQGPYKGKNINDERHLQYLDAYIQVFNAFELFEGGIPAAMENFDEAFQFALDYPFCSLGESFGLRNLGIVNRDCFKDVFPNLEIYKKFCQDALLIRGAREFLGKLTME